MLKIINDLQPFFEDCYRRISVREYARVRSISPPTASTLLALYHKKGLLCREEYRNFIFYYANKGNKVFIDLSRLYWGITLSDLITEFEKKLTSPTIVLFGSLAKAEVKQDSDIDLAVFAHKKKINFSVFEKKLKRNIQVFWFSSLNEIKNKELANNIINGYVLKGRLGI